MRLVGEAGDDRSLDVQTEPPVLSTPARLDQAARLSDQPSVFGGGVGDQAVTSSARDVEREAAMGDRRGVSCAAPERTAMDACLDAWAAWKRSQPQTFIEF